MGTFTIEEISLQICMAQNTSLKQIPVDKNSSKLLTFNILFGCYRFTHMSYGIQMRYIILKLASSLMVLREL